MNSAAGSTCTRAHIASWPVPQYSWHGMSCSPGVVNVVVNVETKPGTSIVLALVRPTTKPWIVSVAVPRNVTGTPAGTTMHCGWKEYCCAISRTVTLPSAPTLVPRLLSTNSPFRCSVLTSTVSTREGGIADQCRPVTTIMATSSTAMPMTIQAQRRSAAIAIACESGPAPGDIGAAVLTG